MCDGTDWEARAEVEKNKITRAPAGNCAPEHVRVRRIPTSHATNCCGLGEYPAGSESSHLTHSVYNSVAHSVSPPNKDPKYEYGGALQCTASSSPTHFLQSPIPLPQTSNPSQLQKPYTLAFSVVYGNRDRGGPRPSRRFSGT